MCGIAGKIIFQDSVVLEKELQKMSPAILHRGPDDEGLYISPHKKVGLLNRRLSIIDLSPKGHMPMNYKNRYWITYNGEIYNFKKLKNKLVNKGHRFRSQTDTEVIMALYDSYGVQCLEYLRGMFAFAIYDIKTNRVFLARDKIGKKPLKFYFKNNVFIFASELKAILTQKEVKKEVDLLAVHHYLTYGFTPENLTGFSGIQKLKPGHYLLLDLETKTIESKCYWKPDFSEKLNLSEAQWCNKIVTVLEESTKLRMIADVPVGAFLSGGVDSSAVVAMMAKNSKTPIKTFTIAFADKKYDESEHALRIAKLFNTDHEVLPAKQESVETLPSLVYQYEEPFADSSAVVTFMVSKLARQYVKVILNGDGGDENFAGYDRYLRWKRDVYLDNWLRIVRPTGLPLVKALNNRAYKFLKKSALPLADRFVTYNSYFTNENKNNLYSSNFNELTKDNNSYHYMRDWFAESDTRDIIDKALYADLVGYFPNMLLAKMDIASMAASLEARSPFLDHNMIELAAKIPYELKVKGWGEHKYILKKALENILPHQNLYRPKMGFSIPLSYWFSDSLRAYAKSNLLSKKARSRKLFNYQVVKNMIESHSEDNDFGPKLWSLLTLEFWFQQYFD